MSSNPVTIENLLTTNGQLSSAHNTLNELYSAYDTHSPSSTSNSSPSPSSLSPSNTKTSDSLTSQLNSNPRKDSTVKLPYPVLSDHRDPSSILVLLQKETQATSKKISDVTKQIDECERRLTSTSHTDNEKKAFKHERARVKQQLDALKKHERRVSLQIDFMTTKTEIKGLEDEYKQMYKNSTSDESQQIKILLGKLKQKMEKMKVYMRERNEEMKKISNGKQRSNASSEQRPSSSQKPQRFNALSSSTADSNRKRPSTNNSLPNKRLKPAAPMVRLSSRTTSHDSKKHAVPPPIVRFVNKTTESTLSSVSPTTPVSSSSTLSPPVLVRASTSGTNFINSSLQQNGLPSVNDDDDDDDDDELHLELNIDELFEDDPYADQSVHSLKPERNNNPCQLPLNPTSSATQS